MADSTGMSDGEICTVSDCGRPRYQSQRFCASHRARFYRYGSPEGKPEPRRRDLRGIRFGRLVALEYSEDERKWLCRCDCGAESHVVSSSLLSGCTRSCGQQRRHITPQNYEQAHEHVRAVRGAADTHECARCRRAPAAHWAYHHDGATHRMDGTPDPWSPAPGDYVPLCVPCHKRADLAAIATAQARSRCGEKRATGPIL